MVTSNSCPQCKWKSVSFNSSCQDPSFMEFRTMTCRSPS
uniref:Uncharacterized protein n=1 Tax=Anguilla anguilla TaxID=7936 RepID=A0A0E9XYJ8_ANGAN